MEKTTFKMNQKRTRPKTYGLINLGSTKTFIITFTLICSPIRSSYPIDVEPVTGVVFTPPDCRFRDYIYKITLVNSDSNPITFPVTL